MPWKTQVKSRAVAQAVKTGDMPNVDLIWMIQQNESNDACFGKYSDCAEHICRWRENCLKIAG